MGKNRIGKVLACLLGLGVCLAFGAVLLMFTVPMEDASYDLSLGWEGEALPQDWVYDQKGWQVYTQTGSEKTELGADELGSFYGLSQPGQTVYYSRVLSESLDSPTLRIATADRSVAVFLEDALLYTDSPELDNRVGQLSLPMLGWDRSEPVVLSLPLDYRGKTLTIAQSTGEWEERITLCQVSLTCGYAYESGLIAQSFRTAIPAALSFGVGAILLAAFLWRFCTGSQDWGVGFLALTAFLWCSYRILGAPFFYQYFGLLPVDLVGLSRMLALTVLLAFLASRLEGRCRLIFSLLAGIHGLLTLGMAVPGLNPQLFQWQTVPEWAGLLTLLGLVAAMGRQWRRRDFFAQVCFPLTMLTLLGMVLAAVFEPQIRQLVYTQLTLGAQGYFLWKLVAAVLPFALLGALAELIHQEIASRTEKALLRQQYRLAQSSFEGLRRHQQEVMMLRHDMGRHLQYLRQSTTDEATARYVEELIGQQESLTPVVQTRNAELDILLNAKLGEARAKGIPVEMKRADAPEKLPLTEAELCALVLNLLDNAIAAAADATEPKIQLDLYQKEGFFLFTCENTRNQGEKSQTVKGHGLGLKIVEQIVQRHGSLLDIQALPGSYRVTVCITAGDS